MEKPPAFSFYAKDFMTGTVTMTLAERGAYVTLLSYQWDSGAVPDDLAAITRILSCSAREARGVWPSVQKKFDLHEDGWRNVRLESQRTKQAIRRQRLSENGKKGGRPAKPEPEKPQESKSFSLDKQTQRLSSSFPSSSAKLETDTSNRSPSDGRAVWMRIIEELEITETNRREFFDPCEVYDYQPGRLTINARKSFIGQWLNKHFWKRVCEVAASIEPGLRVDLVTKSLSVRAN